MTSKTKSDYCFVTKKPKLFRIILQLKNDTKDNVILIKFWKIKSFFLIEANSANFPSVETNNQ